MSRRESVGDLVGSGGGTPADHLDLASPLNTLNAFDLAASSSNMEDYARFY